MRELSEKGQALLDDLQPELADDPFVQQVEDALGREIQRFEDTRADVFHKRFPQYADDTYGILPMLEWLFGLPIAPPVDIETRRGSVLARIRKRGSGAGSDWAAAITSVIGNNWTHLEGPGAYQLTITIPYEPGGFTAGALSALVSKITPANLQILIAYSQGFLVGISRIGLDPL
jgi:hypothetical protein